MYYLEKYHFRNLKLTYQIWTSINVSIVSDYFIRKDIENEIIICCMEKNIQVDFLRYALPKSRIGLPNLDFNEFYCSKRLIHSE